MKMLVYTDVHGNKYALEQLTKTNDYKTADLRVFLGDAVMLCPYPNECLATIWNNGDIFLLGNHDVNCAFGLPDNECLSKPEKAEHTNYMRNKTKPEYIDKLKSMPKDYSIEIQGKKFYFAHFPWKDDRTIMFDPDTPNAPTQNTARLFDNVNADYIIFGHNHKPANFEYDNKHFICVGSLGMNYPGDYIVIDINDDKVDVHQKKIDFDVEKLKQDMLDENYPRATRYYHWFK